MLVSSKIKKGDIITIKTSIGEEMICELDSINNDNYTLRKPLVFGMGQQGPFFADPVMTGDVGEIVPFPKKFVMWVVPTKEEVRAMYLQKTTGIMPVQQSQKIIT